MLLLQRSPLKQALFILRRVSTAPFPPEGDNFRGLRTLLREQTHTHTHLVQKKTHTHNGGTATVLQQPEATVTPLSLSLSRCLVAAANSKRSLVVRAYTVCCTSRTCRFLLPARAYPSPVEALRPYPVSFSWLPAPTETRGPAGTIGPQKAQ